MERVESIARMQGIKVEVYKLMKPYCCPLGLIDESIVSWSKIII